MEKLNNPNLNNKLQTPSHNGYITFYEWKIYARKYEHRTQKEDETGAPAVNMLFKRTK
jgi:hypothetical protein